VVTHNTILEIGLSGINSKREIELYHQISNHPENFGENRKNLPKLTCKKKLCGKIAAFAPIV
jgi:hypothetical protein